MRRAMLSLLVVSVSLASAATAGEPAGSVATPGTESWRAFWGLDERQVEAESTVVRPEGWKSPRKALLLSALIPGAGELYAGSKWKAAVFLAAEVYAWTTYSVYHKKGSEKEDEFEAFADAHWSEQEYWEAIAREAGLDPSDIDALREYERNTYSHSLHEQKDQQYYEMIGKYNQFNAGWDDTDTHRGRDSKNREIYEDMRAEANKFFKRATMGATIAMINHVVSAIDAAWTTVYHNKKLASVRLQATGLAFNGDLVPALEVRIDW